MKASYKRYVLNFRRPGGTSRGILRTRETWFICLEHKGRIGYGECALFKGLSYDDVPTYESKLAWACANIEFGKAALLRALIGFPSIQFGLEQAFLSFSSVDPFVLFPSGFTKSNFDIPINGLIWMGSPDNMKEQIEKKIAAGFTCLKLKIGALDFEQELNVLRSIRSKYSQKDIEIRVDANGAFQPKEALEKLKVLSTLEIHSIEQPIAPGNTEVMMDLCAKTPLPIALDEELIGILKASEKKSMLQRIQPQFIILKPSLVGGFEGCREWITLADKLKIGWWITSALESNIGLNAIAQWTYTLNNTMPQGLGTGTLFTNNIKSPLKVANGALSYTDHNAWNANVINQLCT